MLWTYKKFKLKNAVCYLFRIVSSFYCFFFKQHLKCLLLLLLLSLLVPCYFLAVTLVLKLKDWSITSTSVLLRHISPLVEVTSDRSDGELKWLYFYNWWKHSDGIHQIHLCSISIGIILKTVSYSGYRFQQWNDFEKFQVLVLETIAMLYLSISLEKYSRKKNLNIGLDCAGIWIHISTLRS